MEIIIIYSDKNPEIELVQLFFDKKKKKKKERKKHQRFK